MSLRRFGGLYAALAALAALAVLATVAGPAHSQPSPDEWRVETGFAGELVITNGTEKFDVRRVTSAVTCAAGFEFEFPGLGPQTESTPLWLPPETADFGGWARTIDDKPLVQWELCRDLPDGVLLVSISLPGPPGATLSPATLAALQAVMREPTELPFVIPTSVRLAFGDQAKPIPLSPQTGLLYTPTLGEADTNVFGAWPTVFLESRASSSPCGEAAEVETLVAPRWQLRAGTEGVKACTNLGSGSIEVDLHWNVSPTAWPRVKSRMEATLAAIAEVYNVSRPAKVVATSSTSWRDKDTIGEVGVAATYGSTDQVGASASPGVMLGLHSRSRDWHRAATATVDLALGLSAAKQFSFDASIGGGVMFRPGTPTEIAAYAVVGVDRFGMGEAANGASVIATTAPYLGARLTLGRALFASGEYSRRFWADAHPRETRLGLGYRWGTQPKTRVVALGFQGTAVGAVVQAMVGFGI